MESLDMDTIFKSLLKKEYLTDAEFENIIQIENFNGRILEVFDIMMVKDQNTAVEILNEFRRMTARVRAKEDNGTHPLLNAVVADCIFGFLPMKDIRNCRLVCQQWRTNSSVILRKRVTIHFQTKGPYTFFEDFANSLPEIKFQSFKFWANNGGWNTAEIEEFFETVGPNIKKLRFSPNRLFKEGQELVLKSYDISDLIKKACNLINLKVVGCEVYKGNRYNKEQTLLEMQLSEMSSAKFIAVEGCLISIHDAPEENMRIKPLKISLYGVTFKSGNKMHDDILLNDVIDFSQATKLNLVCGNTYTDLNFDMKSQVLNTQSFQLMNAQAKNWASATGKVYFCYLDSFEEKNRLQIQQLYSSFSTVNLSALPITIEKLHFYYRTTFVSGENINLPHLKYLRIDKSANLDVVAYFTQCSNLVELELGGLYPNPWNITLNVNWIPKSVKRMKIHFDNIHIFTNQNDEGENARQEIEEGCILKLDALILEDYLHCLSSDDVSQMMSVIKPKVLVVSCSDKKRVIDTTSICDFLLANRNLEKFIVGSRDNLHKTIPFELSVFSHFVGCKISNYYQFENHHGKGSEEENPIGTPISEEAFDSCTKMDELDQRFYPRRKTGVHRLRNQ